ncbi:pyridoxamine 5'-phosphate oxidase family protein [Streptomyces sp. NPDC093094]|uniref:pyridoxamine 5'-phosphate oxidase family protein n=1 Tax=Streptomyces sp. NPDC093094 TaxID=3366026 RepID=UPI00380CA6A7
MTIDNSPPVPGPSRQSHELDRFEALRLLGGVSLGRIVFTDRALPQIRPVNHVLDGEDIVIRTHAGAALTLQTSLADGQGVVVAYEADSIDPDSHAGWSVVVTGYARLVTEPDELARYRTMLRPWVDRAMEYAVRIHPELVTGLRLPGTDDRDGGGQADRDAADRTPVTDPTTGSA